jgi:ribosomal protein L37E
MATCEKCWRDSATIFDDHAERYLELLKQRDKDGRACTPEQQAGEYADVCRRCERRTLHQWTGQCMACGERSNEHGEAGDEEEVRDDGPGSG